MKKYVYLFNEGDSGMGNILGGKGANLAEMTNLKIPVPPYGKVQRGFQERQEATGGEPNKVQESH